MGEGCSIPRRGVFFQKKGAFLKSKGEGSSIPRRDVFSSIKGPFLKSKGATANSGGASSRRPKADWEWGFGGRSPPMEGAHLNRYPAPRCGGKSMRFWRTICAFI